MGARAVLFWNIKSQWNSKGAGRREYDQAAMSRGEIDEIPNCSYDHGSSMICRLENPERSISGRPSRRSFLQGAGSLLAVAADWARTENTRPWAPLSKIDRISKHVYAAIAQTTPVVNGNSAIIVTKQGLVIVDSQSSSSAAVCPDDAPLRRSAGQDLMSSISGLA
jgi:hypothetical protein